MAAIKKQYHDNESDSTLPLYKNVLQTRQAAQSFTTVDSYVISSVKILIYRFGQPEIFTVSIREVLGDFPTGGDLAVGTFDADDITEDTNGEWKEIIFDTPYELAADTKYTIYVRNEGAIHDLGPAVYWFRVADSDSYPDGQGIYGHIDGSNWNTGGDYNFETWGSIVQRAKNPSPEDNEEDVNRVTDLTWEAGDLEVDNYDVWFGTPGNMVLVGAEITEELFSINDYLSPNKLDLDTEYEWRIDSYINGELVATGSVWSYTTRAQRTVVLSLPTNGVTDKLLPPFTISWTIDGIGAQYGSFEDQDFLFIYMRKDNADFTEDNLIGNFVQAFVNDDLRIVALTPPVYGSTYYWQVQAGNTAADLADSEVWSFTMLDFHPPAPSFDSGLGYITGRSNMVTIKRLVAAAANKIWYEEDNG